MPLRAWGRGPLLGVRAGVPAGPRGTCLGICSRWEEPGAGFRGGFPGRPSRSLCLARACTGLGGGRGEPHGAATAAGTPAVCAKCRARGRGSYLDLHGVLRLGLLGVQKLDGHDHLSFALQEHHLGTRRVSSLKPREEPRARPGTTSPSLQGPNRRSLWDQASRPAAKCGPSPRPPLGPERGAPLAAPAPHLEAVLVSHAPLGLPLVAGLPGGADAAGGQAAPRGAPLLLVQVELHHLQAHVVTHEVVQLAGRESGGYLVCVPPWGNSCPPP